LKSDQRNKEIIYKMRERKPINMKNTWQPRFIKREIGSIPIIYLRVVKTREKSNKEERERQRLKRRKRADVAGDKKRRLVFLRTKQECCSRQPLRSLPVRFRCWPLIC